MERHDFHSWSGDCNPVKQVISCSNLFNNCKKIERDFINNYANLANIKEN